MADNDRKRRSFRALEKAEGPMQLMAPKLRDGCYAQTNFPSKGEGQTADMTLAPGPRSTSAPLMGFSEAFNANTRRALTSQHAVKREGARIKEFGVDHLAVRTHVEIPAQPGDGPKRLHRHASKTFPPAK